jgi:Ca2+-binding EF-hand superfamily protein
MELTMTKYLMSGAVVAALVAIAPAVAQTAPAAPSAQALHAQHMQQRSAKPGVSRAQLGGHVAAMFQRLDANRDGIITREESQAAKGDRGARKGGKQGAQAERRANRSPEQRPGNRAENRAAMFDRLDTNRDGSISRAEFTAAPALQDRRMAGRDGNQRKAATGAKGMGRMGGMSLGGRMFEMADANRDGRLTMPEATSAAYRHFDMADANRDGQISREERMQVRQRMRGARTERRPG